MPHVPMVKFEHVSMEYKKGGRLALDDINFQAEPGEFVFMAGGSSDNLPLTDRLALD